MLLIIFNMLFSLFIAMAILIIASILSSRSFFNQESPSPYECGFDPKNSARTPFSTRFFILAVLFLVFDLEIILLLPIPLSYSSWFASTLMSSMMFLLILLIGLFHEWHEGSLDWVY